MDIPTSLAIIAFAALIHASFQLSVSVLTLLSGHALGAQKAQTRVLRMTTSYLGGAAVITLLLVSFVALVCTHLMGSEVPLITWAIGCGMALGVGIAVWLFYYRKKRPGTELWVPRALADHLTHRSEITQDSAESFSLGLTSAMAELLFILPSILITALILVGLPGGWQLAGIALYTVVSMGGLLAVWGLVGSGHSLSRVQQWRERNKHFLQFASGSALIALSFFVYVSKVADLISGGV